MNIVSRVRRIDSTYIHLTRRRLREITARMWAAVWRHSGCVCNECKQWAGVTVDSLHGAMTDKLTDCWSIRRHHTSATDIYLSPTHLTTWPHFFLTSSLSDLLVSQPLLLSISSSSLQPSLNPIYMFFALNFPSAYDTVHHRALLDKFSKAHQSRLHLQSE